MKSDTEKSSPTIAWFNLFRSWLFPACGGLLYGYDIGAMSMVLEDLMSAEYADTSWYWKLNDSTTLQGVVVSMVTLGAMLGSIVVFRVESVLGRRREMLVASICYTGGSFAQYLVGSCTMSANIAVAVMCVSRVIYGFGVGFAMHGAPSYIAETAPPKYRGSMVAGKEAMIVIGMLLGYIVGAALQHTVGGWPYVFLAASPVGMMFGVGVYFLPASPRWLALSGNREAAEQSLLFVMPTLDPATMKDLLDDASPPMKTVKPGVDSDEFSIANAYADLTATRASRAGLLAGLGLVVLQQVTGQPSILYYVDTIFSEVGLGNGATISLAAWKLVCTLLAVRYADSRGRRELLFVGCSLMGAALLALVIATAVADSGTAYSWSVLTAMFVYIGGYQVGFGPVTWTIISEIFPLRQRGKALSLAVFTNFACNTLVSFGADDLLALSLPGTFGLFLVLDVYAVWFVFGNVPETRGMSLEEISKMLEKFAHLPMRQPLLTPTNTCMPNLPRRDSAAILNALTPPSDVVSVSN